MKITYAAIIASTLLVAGLAMTVGPSLASDDDRGRRPIRATGEVTTFTLPANCRVPLYECISSEYIDNQHVLTRNSLSIWTGTIDGNATTLDVATRYLTETGLPDFADFTGIGHFRGTAGDSEPGTFAFHRYLTVDYRAFFTGTGPLTWEGRLSVIEGSGMGGLEGICGVVPFQGYMTPERDLITTYDGELRFGDACNGNDD